jgi:hypothetical protein
VSFIFPPVNRGAQVLNKFLGLKSPQSPDSFSQVVTPIVEMLPWWAVSHEFETQTTFAIGAGAVGYLASHNVPAGSYWMPLEWNIELLAVAGATIQVQGAYRISAARTWGVGPISPNAIAGVELRHDVLESRARPLFIIGGQSLGVNVFLNTGTAQTATVRLRVVQFEL